MKKKNGFTLVELVIVIAIIAILVAAAIPVFASAQQASRRAKILADLQIIDSAINVYYMDMGSYPPTSYGILDDTLAKTQIDANGNSKGPWLATMPKHPDGDLGGGWRAYGQFSYGFSFGEGLIFTDAYPASACVRLTNNNGLQSNYDIPHLKTTLGW